MPRRSSKNKLGYIKQVEMEYYNFDDNYNINELPNDISEINSMDNDISKINSNNEIIDVNNINDNFEYIKNEENNNINTVSYNDDNQEEFDYTLLKVIVFLIMV